MAGPEHSPTSDSKYHVKIGDASEASHKRLLYDIHQSERQREEKQSSLSIIKKIRVFGSKLRHGKLDAMESLKHADEYAEQQKSQNFIFAGSELARTSMKEAKTASRQELAAMAEQIEGDGASTPDADIENRIHGLIADYVQADPPMTDEQYESAQLKFLEELRTERPDAYEKTSVFADNIYSIAQQVKADYELHKEIISDDRIIKDLVVTLGGKVEGGLDTDVNRDRIAKAYNMIARTKGGRVASKFINPATMGLAITVGAKIPQIGTKWAIGGGAALSAGIGALKGYVNAETDLANATMDMATGRYKPGEDDESKIKSVGKNTLQYAMGNVPKHELEKHVIEQMPVAEQVAKINDLVESLKALEPGKSPEKLVLQIREEIAESGARLEVSQEIDRDLLQYENEYKVDSGKASLRVAIARAEVELKEHGLDRFDFDTTLGEKKGSLLLHAGVKRAQFRSVKAKMMVAGGIKSAAATLIGAWATNEAINQLGDLDTSGLKALVISTRGALAAGYSHAPSAVIGAGVPSRVAHASTAALGKLGLYETAMAQESGGDTEVFDGGAVDTGKPGSTVDGVSPASAEAAENYPPPPYSGDYVGYPEGVLNTPETAPYDEFPLESPGGDSSPPIESTETPTPDEDLGMIEPQGGTVIDGGAEATGQPGEPVDGVAEGDSQADVEEVTNAVEQAVSNNETGQSANTWESIQNRVQEPRNISHDSYITYGTDFVGEHNELDIQYKVEAERVVIDVSGMEYGVDYNGDGQPDLPSGTDLYGVFYLTEEDHAAGREIRVPIVDGQLVLDGDNKDLAGLFTVENGEVVQQFERFSVASDNGDGSFTFYASNEGHDIPDSLKETLKAEQLAVGPAPEVSDEDLLPHDEREPVDEQTPDDGSGWPEDVTNPPIEDDGSTWPEDVTNPPQTESVPDSAGQAAAPPPPYSGDYVGYPEGVLNTPETAPYDEFPLPPAPEGEAVEGSSDQEWWYGPIGMGRAKSTPMLPALFEYEKKPGEEAKKELPLAKYTKEKRELVGSEAELIEILKLYDALPVALVASQWPIMRGTRNMVRFREDWPTLSVSVRQRALAEVAQRSGKPVEDEPGKPSLDDKIFLAKIATASAMPVAELTKRWPGLEGNKELEEIESAWWSRLTEPTQRLDRLLSLMMRELAAKKPEPKKAEEAPKAKAEALSDEDLVIIEFMAKSPDMPVGRIIERWPGLEGTKGLADLEEIWPNLKQESSKRSRLIALVRALESETGAEEEKEKKLPEAKLGPAREPTATEIHLINAWVKEDVVPEAILNVYGYLNETQDWEDLGNI